MDSTQGLRALSVTYGFLDKNRGTPLRITSLLKGLSKYHDLDLHIASLDSGLVNMQSKHFTLPKNKLKVILLLWKYVIQNKIDVIIGHTLVCYSLLLPLKFLTGKKIVLEMHGFLEEESLLEKKISPATYAITKRKHAFIYRFFDLITTCSDTATDIIKKYNKNAVTIFGGCDTDIFNTRVTPGFFFKEQEDEIVIGYAGNTRVWQGLDFLVEVFTELHSKDKRFKLALLLSEAHSFDAVQGITILSGMKHTEVPRFLASCDILVIPRLKNTVNDISFPSKLPEYLAMGKSVVVSKTSDSFKIVTDSVDGLLFTPGDALELQRVLVSLANQEFRDKLGVGAEKVSRDKLCWEKRVDSLHGEMFKLCEKFIEIKSDITI